MKKKERKRLEYLRNISNYQKLSNKELSELWKLEEKDG